MALYYDLHTHTHHSDGLLAPVALINRASAAGLKALALTDHDGVAGLADAEVAARACGMELIRGIELSTTWGGQTVHIVGLHIDPESAPLVAGIRRLQDCREERGRAIDERLAARGIEGSYDAACTYAKGILGRLHFARALVAKGVASDPRHAFSELLGYGRPAYVPVAWASVGEAVGWITGAGGTAVIAHPARYKLATGALQRLLGEFREAGGQAIEVVSGSHSEEEARRYALLATHHGLLASAGSDFHAPGESRMEVGCLPELPPGCTPVWSAWGNGSAGKTVALGV